MNNSSLLLDVIRLLSLEVKACMETAPGCGVAWPTNIADQEEVRTQNSISSQSLNHQAGVQEFG